MKQAISVLTAIVIVAALAISLVARVSARVPSPAVPTAKPAAAKVPAPTPIDISNLAEPFCWGCSWNQDAPLEFQVDLDLLAPLGNGSDNAAVWFADFVKGGPRSPIEEGPSYKSRQIEIEIDGDTWNVLPGDDRLLREAEPWIDQARCSFYPELWPVEGMETPIPNLLMMLDLARSWTARGKLATDRHQAMDDFRRAIRLGRLLRQDDVTIIQDLVAIACIRIGAEAMYELAREEGDAATMLVGSLVMADKDAMRFFTARRITTSERAFRAVTGGLTDTDVEAIVEQVRNVPERRFRMEGMISLYAIKHMGSPEHRDIALGILEELAGTEDELTVELARRFLDTTLDDAGLEELIDSMKLPIGK